MKGEWRFATMEYGVPCVQMVGINWMQLLFVNSWDTIDKEVSRS